MRVLIFGGAGMIGRKLAERLAREGRIGDRTIESLTLYDIQAAAPPAEAAMPVKIETGDLPAPGEAARLLAGKPDIVFHLAAIVSGQAEQEFDLGYRINMDGTRAVLEAARAAGNYPRVIFASSLAAFGAPLPDPIGDEHIAAPLTSYGTQKAIGELLVSDYTRKGFVDGLALRLPTICVRPGKPNAAASGFFSAIIREPLAGQEAVLPVSDDVMHWHASPRARPVRSAHYRRLAAALRYAPRTRPRLRGGRQLRGDHSRPYRGRAGRRRAGLDVPALRSSARPRR